MIKNSESYKFQPQVEQVIAVAEAGLKSIQPGVMLEREVSYNSATQRFKFGHSYYDLDEYDRVILLGIGAGTSAAIDYLKNILPRLPIKIVVMDPEAEFNPEAGVYSVTHHPTANNAEATRQLLKYGPFSEDDLVIAITDSSANSIVNAGSSMPPDQQRAILEGLGELHATNEEIVTVAIHLAEGRGGDLARVLEPAQILNYIITDRLDDSGRPVATSPFQQHGSSLYQAKEIVEKYDILVYCNLDSCVFISSEISAPHSGVRAELLASPLTWYEYIKLAAAEFNVFPEVFVSAGAGLEQNPVWQQAQNAIALLPHTSVEELALANSQSTQLFVTSGVYGEPAGKLIVAGTADIHAITPESPTFNVGTLGIKLT